jgi:hypothetical protein
MFFNWKSITFRQLFWYASWPKTVSLRVWQIGITQTDLMKAWLHTKVSRGSHAVGLLPWRDGWWLETMLLHTICNVITVKLIIIDNSWCCIVYRNFGMFLLVHCIMYHCIGKTSLMTEMIYHCTFWGPSPNCSMFRLWKQTWYLWHNSLTTCAIIFIRNPVFITSYKCMCKIMFSDGLKRVIILRLVWLAEWKWKENYGNLTVFKRNGLGGGSTSLLWGLRFSQCENLDCDLQTCMYLDGVTTQKIAICNV